MQHELVFRAVCTAASLVQAKAKPPLNNQSSYLSVQLVNAVNKLRDTKQFYVAHLGLLATDAAGDDHTLTNWLEKSFKFLGYRLRFL
jgi:hypothetical protein